MHYGEWLISVSVTLASLTFVCVVSMSADPSVPPGGGGGALCGQGMFVCFSGQCVPQTAVCDFTWHCDDGTDEVNCPCKSQVVTWPACLPVCILYLTVCLPVYIYVPICLSVIGTMTRATMRSTVHARQRTLDLPACLSSSHCLSACLNIYIHMIL